VCSGKDVSIVHADCISLPQSASFDGGGIIVDAVDVNQH